MKTKFTLVIVALAAFITAQAQWLPVASNTDKSLHAVSFSGNNGVISGGNGRILYSADAGVTWKDSAYSPFLVNKSVAYVTASKVIVGSSGRYYISNNSGSSFETPISLTGFGDFTDIVFTSATDGIAISDYCRIATTTNGGSNWTLNGNPCGNSSEMRDLSFPTATVGYYCGANGNVGKTTDGGTSWAPVTRPGKSNTNYYSIQFFDADNGFIAGDAANNGVDTFVFKKTADGGATWTDMSAGLLAVGAAKSNALFEFLFVTPQLGYIYNASKNLLYKTIDGGISWVIDYTAPGGTNINKIYAGNGFAIAVGGGGFIIRTDLGSVGIQNEEGPQPITLYPNPVANHLNIGGLSAGLNATINIVDVSGKVVYAQPFTQSSIDVSALANGFYLLQVTEGGKTRQQKLIVQR